MMNNELYHHGTLGMKWGVRRYQNKDGTLTNAGKKRVAKLSSEYDQLIGKKLGTKSDNLSSAPAKKSISELTDDELREKLNRLTLERNYLDTQRQITSLTPKQISRGQRFINSLTNDVIAPAARDAGKTLLTKALTKAGSKLLGVSEKELKDGTKEIKKDVKSEINTKELRRMQQTLDKYFKEKNND